MPNSKNIKLLNSLKKVKVCVVSTYSKTEIKNRMMHFAFTPDLKFYLSSIKSDPKTKQILLHSEISLLIYIPGKKFSQDQEIEVTGYARIIHDKNRKEKAVSLLRKRSPIVEQLCQTGYKNMLAFIEIIPVLIKHRIVKDVLKGISPTILSFQKHTSLYSDWGQIKKKLKTWIIETRYPFLTITILPVLLGTAVAFVRKSIFHPFHFFLVLLGTVSLHLGTNIINDYFDHKSGNDEINQKFIRPFSGGSRMIQLGLLTPLEVLMGAILFFIIGSSIGIYLTFQCGIPIFILGLIGFISGFFYTAPLFNWVSKGIGELLVGFNFGVLVTLGSYYVQVKAFSNEILWVSIPLGILITAILWINEFPDYEADKKSGKKTTVVRLGTKRASKLFKYLILSSYLVLATGMILGYLSEIVLIGLISLPSAIKSIIYVERFNNNPFDMAPGNAFAVLTFNILAIALIVVYLWISFKIIYILPVIFIAFAYLLWNYRTIKKQNETFIRLKEIYK